MRVMIILWDAERVKALWTEAPLDNSLGLGNNLLHATFFKIDRTI